MYVCYAPDFYTGNKLYSTVAEAQRCEQRAQGYAAAPSRHRAMTQKRLRLSWPKPQNKQQSVKHCYVTTITAINRPNHTLTGDPRVCSTCLKLPRDSAQDARTS